MATGQLYKEDRKGQWEKNGLVIPKEDPPLWGEWASFALH